jgi:HAD superfamily hydrolase (TIGR01509 family)
MNDKKVFTFDMDGVLVDTVPLMYDEVYCKFLSEFGIKGTQDEFAKKVNGPKIAQIVTNLKEAHTLPGEHADLLNRYNYWMQRTYDIAPLTPGVHDLMEHLRSHDWQIAIGSASAEPNIRRMMEMHKFGHYIDFASSGDHVKNAKPAPDIYNRVRDHVPGQIYVGLEDSDNGIRALAAAKMDVIFFNPDKRASKVPELIAHTVGAMRDVPNTLDAVLRKYVR